MVIPGLLSLFLMFTAGKNTKWDKVVKREICQVTLRGTEVCGLQDSGPGEANASYMMAIAEEVTYHLPYIKLIPIIFIVDIC